ncbi:hypothetical protein DXC97_22550 [Lachnospiraceae bacterium TF09-5]|nr:hypothetical protein DXC97_22550 [Lachnospiraceae bacterium TF09-5]
MFKEETTKKMEHKLKQVVGEVYGYKLLRMYKKLRFRIHGWCYDPIRENEWRDPYYASKYRPGGRYYVFRFVYGGVGIFDCIKNFIVSAQWAEENGYIPLVSFERLETFQNGEIYKDNFWDKIYLPYQGKKICDVINNDLVIVDNVGTNQKVPIKGIKSIEFSERYAKDYWNRVGMLYEKYCVLLPKVKELYNENIEKLFPQGKKVLGVCIREGFGIANEVNLGPLRTKELRETNPKEPSIDHILDIVTELLEEWKCDYIYLSAQFLDSISLFQKVFPGKVLFYDREYISRKDYIDAYNKMQEDCLNMDNIDNIYISSTEKIMRDYVGQIYALAECDSLIATDSGGTRGALMISHGNYEHVKVFQTQVW